MNTKTKSNLYSLPVAEKAIIAEIKAKPELQSVSDTFVHGYLVEYLRKNRITLPINPKSAKLIVKDIRAILRLKTGRFQTSDSTQHVSTKERLRDYPLLRKLIDSQNPKSILDLGCGINPTFLATPNIRYYAYDIQESDIDLVQNFFDKNKIVGKAEVADITRANFPSADLCLVLKVLDVIDVRGHKQSETLLKRIPSKHLIVSFSTKTLSGKPMNHPQRGWIERLCTRLGYSYTLAEAQNEIFYLIEKH